jgi:hypothetical protein
MCFEATCTDTQGDTCLDLLFSEKFINPGTDLWRDALSVKPIFELTINN